MKRSTKRKIPVLLAFILLLVLSVPALAAGMPKAAPAQYSGDTLSGSYACSKFLAGQNVYSDADVEGILLAAGYRVQQNGWSEYALLAGQSVRLDGTTENDAFLAGYDVQIRGTVARDVFAAGNNVTVSGLVARNAYIGGSTVTLTGWIGGDVYLSAETIVIDPAAVIGGTLHYNSSAQITAPSSATAGAQVYEDQQQPEPEPLRELGEKALDCVMRFAGIVALALVLLWLTPLWPRVDKTYSGAPFGKYAKAFGIGFGVLAGVPVLFIILLITRFGVRLSFVLLLAYIAALVASPVFLSFFLGKLFWRDLCKRRACFAAELTIGAALWIAASCIPVLSFAAGFVSAPLGLGVVTLLLGRGKKQPALPENGTQNAAASSDPTPPQSEYLEED